MGKRRNRIAFCVDVNGITKRLFDVEESIDGTLRIYPRVSQVTYIDPDSPFAPWSGLADKIKNEKYSCHTNPDSDATNSIQFTSEREFTGTRQPIHTNALKVHDGLCPIFYQMCPKLRHDDYNCPDEITERVSLCSFDERKFQLHFFTILSKKTRTLDVSTAVNSISREFKLFNITVIWAFCEMPATFGLSYRTPPLQTHIRKVPYADKETGNINAYRDRELEQIFKIHFINTVGLLLTRLC